MFQPGDIAACYGADFGSRFIRYATAELQRPVFGPSHVAMMSFAGPMGPRTRVRWYESTTFCPTPCLAQQQLVAGVQVQWPEQRITHYTAAGGRVEIYRLNPLNQLSPEEVVELTGYLNGFIGTDYDTGGAALSATRVLKASRLFPIADLNSVFCSELLAAVLMRMNRLNHRNPARFNPASLMRELLSTGMYRLQGVHS